MCSFSFGHKMLTWQHFRVSYTSVTLVGEVNPGSSSVISVLSLMLCSNSCMSGRKWAWPRSGCTSVTSTARNALTVVLPETPTAPGMVSPVPDIILLECTLRGNRTRTPPPQTHTHTHMGTNTYFNPICCRGDCVLSALHTNQCSCASILS